MNDTDPRINWHSDTTFPDPSFVGFVSTPTPHYLIHDAHLYFGKNGTNDGEEYRLAVRLSDGAKFTVTFSGEIPATFGMVENLAEAYAQGRALGNEEGRQAVAIALKQFISTAP